MKKKIVGILVVTLLIGTAFFPAVNTLRIENDISAVNKDFHENISIDSNVDEITVGDTDFLEVTLRSGDYVIKNRGDYSEIVIDGFGSILNPGKPKLPYRTFLVGLPPGGEVISVELIDMETQEIPGSYDIIIVPSFVGADGVVKEPTYGTFSGGEVYPDQVWKFLGMGQMRKYDFARISFCPMSYYAKDGKLVLYESITLKIDYEIVKEVSDELLADRVMDDLASEMIINYPSINSFYSTSPMVRTGPQDMGYVIITVDALKNSLNDFITWKEYLGYTVYVVTKEEITAEYPGVDPPEKIRNYLKDTYVSLGLKYVLFVGSLSSIPARDCYPVYNDHSIKIVTEHYYADLTGDWDSDGDGYFGENKHDNWDVYPEVYVGRIPVDDQVKVNDLLGKSMSFETDTSQEMNTLLLGAIINYENQEHSGVKRTDGAEITEELREILEPGGVGITTMYERDGLSPSIYSCDIPITRENVINELKNGYRLVNWHSHGTATAVQRFIWTSDDGDDVPESHEIEKKDYLNIDVDWDSDYDGYSIIFAGSCRSNSPDVPLSLGESIYEDGPAAVFIGSRATSFEPYGWDDENDGGLGTFQYHFNEYLIDINEKQSCGEALFNSKTYCYDHFDDYLEYHIYDIYGLKIEGDPSVSYRDIPRNTGFEDWYTYVGDGDVNVNVANGNLYIYDEDLALNDRFDAYDHDEGDIPDFVCEARKLKNKRSYNSHPIDPPFGLGWTHNNHVYLVINEAEGTVLLHDGDGSIHVFTKNAEGYTSPPGIHSLLTHQEDGSFILHHKHGKQCYFDTDGKRTMVEDVHGNQLTMTYDDADRLTKVTDDAGNYITYTYDNLGRIIRVTDSTGRNVQYEYTSSSCLSKVTDPMGESTFYTYNDDLILESITDPNGKKTVFTYDNNGRVHEIIYETPDPITAYTFEYDTSTGTTYVTNAHGDITSYTYNEQGTLIRITDPYGNTETYQWDDDMNIISYTNKNDVTTTYEYDGWGNQLKTIAPLGYVTTATYDSIYHKITSYTDANGYTTRYEYDDTGNLIRTIDPLGHTESYDYDQYGNRIQLTNKNNDVITYEYDDTGNAITKTTTIEEYRIPATLLEFLENHPMLQIIFDNFLKKFFVQEIDIVTSYEYDAVGNLIKQVDPDGSETQYEYDKLNQMTRFINPLGATTIYEYDAVGNLIRQVNPDGGETQYEYDILNQLTQLTDPLGYITLYEYDSVGNRIRTVHSNGQSTTFEYDKLHRKIKEINALTYTTTYTYDPIGTLIKTVDANGQSTTYAYDDLNRLLTETTADGATTTYTFDPGGNIITMSDANGYTTTYEYDALNHLTKETYPEGSIRTYTYDPMGNIISDIEINGYVTQYEYDALGRVIETSDTVGSIATYKYDSVGHLIKETNANGQTTSYEYDKLGKPTKMIDPMGFTVTYQYDSMGNLIQQTNANGQTTSYEYDKLGKLTRIIDSMDSMVTYQYDSMGNLIQQTNANGQTTSYEYDAVNQLLTEIYPDGTTRMYTYDPVGNIKSRTDQLGVITFYEYDACNRLISRDYPDTNDDFFSYDKLGQMQTASNQHSILTFTHDALGRLSKTTQNSYTLTYDYDVLDKQRIIHYPSGKTIIETRDGRYRLLSVEDNRKGIIATFTYDEGDRLRSKTYNNGVKTDYEYTDNNHVALITYIKGSTDIAGFQYAYDPYGNIQYKENILSYDQSKPYTYSELYAYDDLYRLTEYTTGKLVSTTISNPVETRTWTFDASGNCQQFTINGNTYQNTPNQVNEYDDFSTNGPPPIPDDDGIPDDFKDLVSTPQADGYNFKHDKNGNLIDDGINMYTYDYENRLLRVTRKSDNMILGEYTYDPLGRRIEKKVTGINTDYIYDGWRVIEEYTLGSFDACYVYGDAIDDILTSEIKGTTSYYHATPIGSIIALTNENGEPIERYTYNPYGSVSIMDSTGEPLAHSVVQNPYFFTGRRYDEDAGLYYFRTRSYNPETGRFLQRDATGITAGEPNAFGGNCLYQYLENNPLLSSDPLGHDTIAGVSANIRFNLDICTGNYRITGGIWVGAGYELETWWDTYYIGFSASKHGNLARGRINGFHITCGECLDCCEPNWIYDFFDLPSGRRSRNARVGLGVLSCYLSFSTITPCKASIGGGCSLNAINYLPFGALISRAADFVGAEATAGIEGDVSLVLCVGERGISAESGSIILAGVIRFGWGLSGKDISDLP